MSLTNLFNLIVTMYVEVGLEFKVYDYPPERLFLLQYIGTFHIQDFLQPEDHNQHTYS